MTGTVACDCAVVVDTFCGLDEFVLESLLLLSTDPPVANHPAKDSADGGPRDDRDGRHPVLKDSNEAANKNDDARHVLNNDCRVCD